MMSNKPIRVLQVLSGMNRGGAETFVMNIYRHIDRNKIQFDFVVHTEDKCDYDDEILDLGGKIIHAPHYIGINHYRYCKWWNDFFHNNPDYYVIHGHIRSTASIYLRIAKKYGLRTICHSHSTSNGKGLLAQIKNIYQHGIVKYSDFLIACSDNSGKWLFGSKPFSVVKNGICVKAFTFNEDYRKKYRRELGINDYSVVYGHVGRFHDAKNHLFLINVFELISKNDADAVLLLVGDGELKPIIEKLVQNKSLQDKVLFTGVRTDIAELLSVMDIFLFPSKWEGFPVSLLEAQAAGLPCFVSDKITSEALIASNVYPLPILNADTWYKEIITKEITRLNNSDLLIEAGFDIENVAHQLEKLYYAILC